MWADRVQWRRFAAITVTISVPFTGVSPVFAQYHPNAPKLSVVPTELAHKWQHPIRKRPFSVRISNGRVEFHYVGVSVPLLAASWKGRELRGYLAVSYRQNVTSVCPAWRGTKWFPIRLTLSADGTRLQGSRITKTVTYRSSDPSKLCKITRERWIPASYVRVTKPHGWLRVVEAARGVVTPARIGLVFDASGSMRQKLADGSRKIDIAKRVIRTVANSLPNGAQMGLRVYGHRLKSWPKGPSCRDTELVVPFANGNRARLAAAINKLQPRGQTPIGLSLSKLAADFGTSPGFRLVVLVSDGIETCAPRPTDRYYPLAVIKRLQARGVKIQVNVVGFGVGKGKTQRFLKRIADQTGGGYFGAQGARDLGTALRKSFSVSFTVMDRAGKIIGRGAVGGPRLKLPVGAYRVSISGAISLTEANVRVLAQKRTVLTITRKDGKATVVRGSEK